MKVLSALAIAMTLTGTVSSLHAETSLIENVAINSVRTSATGSFGGCFAQISKNVNTGGDDTLNCGSGTTVSFDCDGTNISKSAGQTSFSQAQLGMVAEKCVDLRVDDTKTYNVNVCLASDVFVKKTSC